MIYFVKPLNDWQAESSYAVYFLFYLIYIATFLTKINKGIFSFAYS